MFSRIQKVGPIYGSNNLIINGDVIDNNEEKLTTIAMRLVRQEMAVLSEEAKEEMRACVNECVQKVLEQVMEKKLEEKLEEFSKPAAQWAFYSILKGYMQSETEEQREMLVDSMIDRMQQEWNSTERIIIDSAIEILPKLTPATLSTLGLLQLREQIFLAPFGTMIDLYFCSLTPLAEQMERIGMLETEYLRQEKLIIPLPGVMPTVPLERLMLTNYDLFFRKPLPAGVYEAYCKEHPEAHEAVTDEPMQACMMWIDGTNGGQTGFCCPSSKVLKATLRKRQQEYIIPHVDVLMGMMSPFTEQEVRDYFVKFTPVWKRLFDLFSSAEFTRYSLSITGQYLGGKILAKVSHGKPLPLSSYKRDLI